MKAKQKSGLRPRAILFAAGIALSGAWSLGSGYYIVFHDHMMVSLLKQQATMQYAYEDRLASLQAALDDANNRNDREDDAQSLRGRDIEARAAKLEANAARLDEILAVNGSTPGVRPHAELDGLRRSGGAGHLDTRLASLETHQRKTIQAWSARIQETATRIGAALAELGLPDADQRASGGPFIPLPDAAATIDTDLDGLRVDLAHRDRLASAIAGLPLRLPVEGRLDVTSGYGTRRDPFLGRIALHSGIDLRGDYGTPVTAAAGGVVTSAGPEAGYGTMVEIDHANGYATRYAHLSSTAAVVGQSVAAGTLVGRIGTTGRSTGPHLHYEVRIAGQPVDPARYISLAEMIADR